LLRNTTCSRVASKMLSLPDREKQQRIDFLLALGSEQTEPQIRALLQRHDWNVDAAAGAIFDPPPAEEHASMGSNVQSNVNISWGTSNVGWAESSAPSWDMDSDLDPALRHNTPVPDHDEVDFNKYVRGRSKERVDNGALNSRLSSNKRPSLFLCLSSLKNCSCNTQFG
jgi:hypothetical protein